MKKELKKAILTLAMENIKKDEKLKIHLNKDNNLTTDKSLFFHGILTKYNADDLEKFISDLSDNLKVEELS
jgi:hypothetical protein